MMRPPPAISAPAISAPGQQVGGTEISYLVKHWRGELSLTKSYWINTVLIGLPFNLFFSWIANSQLYEDSYVLAVRLFFGVLIVYIVVWVWQLVGLWRSARNHIATTKRFFWARCVQGLVVLGCISALSVYAPMIPLYIEIGKIATGLDEIDAYTITLLEENTELQLHGRIVFGLTEAVQKELDKAPNVWVIHLNSEGGRTLEARKLHDLIDQRGLATYTEAGCNSACVIAFVAGTSRILNAKAQLGLHRGSIPGLPDESLRDEYEAEKLYFIRAGVDRLFVEKVYNTPSDEMWYPSVQELIEAGVITHTSDGSEIVDRR